MIKMDYTPLLERIAVASEAIVNGKAYYFSVGAILTSAFIGFVASNRIYRKQQESETSKNQETIEMINFLLIKEIEERWQQTIKLDLENVFQRKSKLEILHGYQSMELNTSDFFIIKRVSENFQSFHFIGNELVKDIIDAYLTLNDFTDMCTGAKSLYSKIENHKQNLVNNGTDEDIDFKIENMFDEKITHYNECAKDSMDRIDRALSKLHEHLGKYEALKST